MLGAALDREAGAFGLELYASFNAGADTIKVAQRLAIEPKLDPGRWDDLILGGNKSAFHDAVAKEVAAGRLAKGVEPDRKLVETRDYVTAILDRQK